MENETREVDGIFIKIFPFIILFAIGFAVYKCTMSLPAYQPGYVNPYVYVTPTPERFVETFSQYVEGRRYKGYVNIMTDRETGFKYTIINGRIASVTNDDGVMIGVPEEIPEELQQH